MQINVQVIKFWKCLYKRLTLIIGFLSLFFLSFSLTCFVWGFYTCLLYYLLVFLALFFEVTRYCPGCLDLFVWIICVSLNTHNHEILVMHFGKLFDLMLYILNMMCFQGWDAETQRYIWDYLSRRYRAWTFQWCWNCPWKTEVTFFKIY